MRHDIYLASALFLLPALLPAPDSAAAGTKPPAKAPPVQGTPVLELAAFDKAVQAYMEERSIVGGVLAVMKNGKLLLAHGYGWRDKHAGTLMGPETPFRIASVTKPITLAGLMKLIAQGKLSLATKVFDLLGVQPPPGRPMDKRLLDITVQHLIDHKGGWDRKKSGDPMFQSVKIAKALGKPSPPSADDIVHYMMGQPLDFDPGSKSVYSNFGYCVLGRVIEKVSGQRYIDYQTKELFQPLGLKSSGLARSLPQFRNPAEPLYLDPASGVNVFAPKGPHVPAPDGSFCIEAMDAHGGLIASAPDLVRFLDAYWMNGQPRKGGNHSFSFFGSLPGTWTVAIQRPDGLSIAAFFNQRTDPSGLKYEAISDVLNKTADSIQQWPH